jgi:NAD(P)-dependent dehydrogenase (short-subunit alcohol dehydrogenase family)
MLCDFASLTQIRALAADVIASRPRLHILVNNAGSVSVRPEVTVLINLLYQNPKRHSAAPEIEPMTSSRSLAALSSSAPPVALRSVGASRP